jgi:hypothetical protein
MFDASSQTDDHVSLVDVDWLKLLERNHQHAAQEIAASRAAP